MTTDRSTTRRRSRSGSTKLFVGRESFLGNLLNSYYRKAA
jgi:hypothetical protein